MVTLCGLMHTFDQATVVDVYIARTVQVIMFRKYLHVKFVGPSYLCHVGQSQFLPEAYINVS